MPEPISLALKRMQKATDRAVKAARLAHLVDMAYTAEQVGDYASHYKHLREADQIYEELNAANPQ